MAVIVDYGMGNLRSVQKAVERVGSSAVVSSDGDAIRDANRLILPGVGAFEDGMRGLRERGLVEPIRAFLARGRPFLGICLGMQLLFDESEECENDCTGLGALPGRVVRFPDSPEHKVPHMGWNQVTSRKSSPLLAGVDPASWFYFVHSYYAVPGSDEDYWLETRYIESFCAAVSHEHIHATQFHPEKSQAAGLQLLENFCNLD